MTAEDHLMVKDSDYFINDTMDNYFNQSIQCSDEVFVMVTFVTDIYDYILFGINLFGILANIYVCWAAVHFYQRWSEMSHLLVFSMTAADTTLCLIHQVRTILVRFVALPQLVNVIASVALMAVTWISWSASGFSVILLNVEKIVYFHWPLNYNDYVTLTKTNIAICSCWIMCLLYAVLLLATATYACGSDICIIPHYEIYRTYVILFCVVPALSSGVLSLYLWCTVRAKRRSSTPGRKSTNYQPSQTGTTSNVNLKQQLKTVVFIFTTTGWIVLSWVPARVYYILLLESCSAYVIWFGWTANCLLSISPMINPFITVLIYPCYRRLTVHQLKLVKRRKSSTTTTEYKSIKTQSIALDATPI